MKVSEDVADAFKEFGAEISQDDSTSGYSWNGKSILVNKGNGKYQLDLTGREPPGAPWMPEFYRSAWL